jgi:formylglycine-generating enzyme required for sulfatase activity
MHGNVPEWCWDRYDPDYYQHAARVNPSGSTRGTRRVFRGGSVNDAPSQTTSSSRNPLGTSYGGFLNPVGLRVARDAS